MANAIPGASPKVEGKVCGHCGRRQPFSEFNKRATSKDGKQSYCRPCNRNRSRAYYQENHDHHISTVRSYRKRRRLRLRDRIDSIRVQNGCALCPEDDPVCLEFHHLDPKEKDFEIGAYHRVHLKWSVILQEIRKCVVLCSNCHKKVHAGKRFADASMLCDVSVDMGSKSGTVA